MEERASDSPRDFQHDFTGAQVAGVLAISVLGGCFPALQPILLGALEAAGRIDAALVGRVATVEAISMAISTMLAAALLPPRHLRLLAMGAMAAIAAANALTAISGVTGILLGRAVSGMSSGILLWILVGMMTRAANPGRIFAIYVTCQGIVAFVLSALMTQWAVPALGAEGGYGLLVAGALALLLPCVLVPRAYAATGPANRASLPNLSGGLALASIFCFLAGLFAFWVYLPMIAAAQGHAPAAIGGAISIGLAGQILGGLVAIGLAGRVGALAAGVGSALALAAIVAAVAGMRGEALLYAGLLAFNLLWMFAPPFQLPLLMQLDPSNRSAMYVSPAQLFGVAAGPSLAAAGIGLGPRGPALVAIGLFGLSLALLLAARARGAVAPPRPAPEGAAG